MCRLAVGIPKLRVHSLGNPFVPFGDQFSLCRFNANDILLNSVHKLNNPTIYSPTKRHPRSCHMISSGTNPLNQFYRRNPMRTQVLLLRPFIYNCHATSKEPPSATKRAPEPMSTLVLCAKSWCSSLINKWIFASKRQQYAGRESSTLI